MKRTCIHCGERFETREPKTCSVKPPEGGIQPCEGKPWGFAAMDPEKRRLSAIKGARLIHLMGLAHKFEGHAARVAGQRGGLSPNRRRSGAKQNDPYL